MDALLAHCERGRFRFALVDPPKNLDVAGVRAFRSRFDSASAALYYPWLRISDPTPGPDPGTPPTTLDVPPSGALAGIFSRSDTERGVHKAPANQVVKGIRGFVTQVTAGGTGHPQPRGRQRAALLRGAGQHGLGRSDDLLGSRVEVRQHPAAAHLSRALDRQVDTMGSLRTQQRTALGEHRAASRSLPRVDMDDPVRSWEGRRRRGSSSAATARP